LRKILFRCLLMLTVLLVPTLIVSAADLCGSQRLTTSMNSPSSSAVLYWQRQTGLPYSDIESALTLSGQHNVDPTVIFALREMNIEAPQIERFVEKLSRAYKVLNTDQKDIVDPLAYIFDIRPELANSCIRVGASPTELLYILYI
jgi:hypothetical protein